MIVIMNQSLQLFIEKKKPYQVPPSLMTVQKEGYILLTPRQLKLTLN